MLIYLLAGILLVNGQFEVINTEIKCDEIDEDLPFAIAMEKCYEASSIGGTGSLRLGDHKDRALYNFFQNKVYINISLFIDHTCSITRLFLGNTQYIKSKDPMKISLYIENSKLRSITADSLREIHGVNIRGNKFLSKETLDMIYRRAAYDKPRHVQDFGECNLFFTENSTTPDFNNCSSANHLYLLEGEYVPPTFNPTRIAGCVYLKNLNISHDMMQNMTFADVNNFDCDEGVPQVIEGNPIFCIKEFNFFLHRRNISHHGNDNSDCRFHCYEGQGGEDTRNDISDYRQRWCETLDGDLVINDDLADKVNITEITMYLKKITGRIIIANLTNQKKNRNYTVEEIHFPSLETLSGGELHPDVLIYVNNTKLKNLTFPRLMDIIHTEKAMVITENNPDLKIHKDQLMIVDVAANGIPISVPKSIEAEDEEEEESHLALILGSVLGGVGLLAIVAGVILVVVLLKKKKSKKGAGKKGLKQKTKSEGTESKDKENEERHEKVQKNETEVPLLEKKEEEKKKKKKESKENILMKMKGKMFKKNKSKEEPKKAKGKKEKTEKTDEAQSARKEKTKEDQKSEGTRATTNKNVGANRSDDKTQESVKDY